MWLMLLVTERNEEKREKQTEEILSEKGTARWQSALSIWHLTSLVILFKVKILIKNIQHTHTVKREKCLRNDFPLYMDIFTFELLI